MRKVVDSNFLRSPSLREYLQQSSDNYAVLTDYAAMEAYKGDTLASIYASMDILAEFPKQVIVLKGTQEVCGLRPQQSELPEALIETNQSEGFAEFCSHLRAAKMGDVAIQREILYYGREASAQMERMLPDAANMPAALDGVVGTWNQQELQTIRSGERFTLRMIDKMMKQIMTMAAFMFRDHPKVTCGPNADELERTFIFRIALCHYLLAIRWMEMGGSGKLPANIEGHRNDIVDLHFAAFATYFDGLLTNDNKLKEIYLRAVILLELLSPVGGE